MQTSIQTDGYRSLREGEDVEFNIESGDDGRTKAVNVTGPNGAPPQVRVRSLRLFTRSQQLTRIMSHEVTPSCDTASHLCCVSLRDWAASVH